MCFSGISSSAEVASCRQAGPATHARGSAARSRWLVGPGLRQHLQLAFNQAPLRNAETPARVHPGPVGARHTDCRPWVAHEVVLVDQEAMEVLQNRDCVAWRGVALSRGRQRPLERPPEWRPASTPAVAAPAAARLRIGQEIPELRAVLVAAPGAAHGSSTSAFKCTLCRQRKTSLSSAIVSTQMLDGHHR